MPRPWTQEENDWVSGEEPQGQGLQRKMELVMQDMICTFCTLNSHAMEKWLNIFEGYYSLQQDRRPNHLKVETSALGGHEKTPLQPCKTGHLHLLHRVPASEL